MKTNNITFGTNPQKLINTLPGALKPVAKLMASQEGANALSNIRFVQDTVTNWAPKAIFSRSKADFAETSFLEFAESFLVYYCPKILGENVFRKAYSKNLGQSLGEKVSKPLAELKKDKTLLQNGGLKKLAPVKAAIALSCMAIPLTEFSLNYIKNLFTLKVFKQADFDNIANLNKNGKTEKDETKTKVKKSAIRNIATAAALFGGCLGASMLLVKKGQSSKALQSFSDALLDPGNKLFPNNKKHADFVNKYFSIDFADNNGKLALSRGQLTSCVVIGGAGYFGASKDRGKQNFLETLFRYPLVGFYVITGSELFEKGFKKILKNKDSYKNIIKPNLDVPKFSELPQIAEKLAKQNKSSVEGEFAKLTKQKAIISGVPFLFSLGFMGLFVAGISRVFTQYRYNHDHKNDPDNITVKTFINPYSPKNMDDFKRRVATKQYLNFAKKA